MDGIPTPLERGYGQLSYAGLGCSYDGHREDSHPMSSYAGLGLAIYLGVEGCGFCELGF
jgi:hypothetical protein